MTEFVIRAITDKPITVVENVGEILTELKRQGNNLNQAVRICTTTMIREPNLIRAYQN